MLKPTDFSPASVKNLSIVSDLTAQKALAGLVYRSDVYKENPGYYGDVYAKIRTATDAGLAIIALGVPPPVPLTNAQKEILATAQVLAAIAYRLNNTISLAVEDEGTQDARSYFSSRVNWEELAMDVLNEFYLPVGLAGSVSNSFIITDRALCDWRTCGQPLADETFALLSSRVFRPYRPYLIGAIGNGWY